MEGDAIPARCRHARYLPGFCLHAHTRRVEHGRRTGRSTRESSAAVPLWSNPERRTLSGHRSTPCASSFAYRQTRLSATALRGPALRRQSSHLDSFTRRGALRPPTLHPAARIDIHVCAPIGTVGGRVETSCAVPTERSSPHRRGFSASLTAQLELWLERLISGRTCKPEHPDGVRRSRAGPMRPECNRISVSQYVVSFFPCLLCVS